MELTMSQCRAVTKKLAVKYRRGSKVRKGQILDQVCELNRWHRSHARKALKQALMLQVVKQQPVKQPLCGKSVIIALRFLWAVQSTPCGWLLAAGLSDLAPRLRRFKELNIDDDTAVLLLKRVSVSWPER
jgi:hypothetical protein